MQPATLSASSRKTADVLGTPILDRGLASGVYLLCNSWTTGWEHTQAGRRVTEHAAGMPLQAYPSFSVQSETYRRDFRARFCHEKCRREGNREKDGNE